MSTGPRRILVATDFSAHARHALDYAATIARDRGARLILVHSSMPPTP